MKRKHIKLSKRVLSVFLSAVMIIAGLYISLAGEVNADDDEPEITDTVLDPDNIVVNGNFADGTTGWGTYNCVISAAVVDGTNAALVSNRGNNFASITQTLNGPFLAGDSRLMQILR